MQSYNNTNANAYAMIGLTHFAMLLCPVIIQTVQPLSTLYVKSRYFLIAEESCEHQSCEHQRGTKGVSGHQARCPRNLKLHVEEKLS